MKIRSNKWLAAKLRRVILTSDDYEIRDYSVLEINGLKYSLNHTSDGRKYKYISLITAREMKNKIEAGEDIPTEIVEKIKEKLNNL